MAVASAENTVSQSGAKVKDLFVPFGTKRFFCLELILKQRPTGLGQYMRPKPALFKI